MHRNMSDSISIKLGEEHFFYRKNLILRALPFFWRVLISSGAIVSEAYNIEMIMKPYGLLLIFVFFPLISGKTNGDP